MHGIYRIRMDLHFYYTNIIVVVCNIIVLYYMCPYRQRIDNY